MNSFNFSDMVVAGNKSHADGLKLKRVQPPDLSHTFPTTLNLCNLVRMVE